MRHGIFMFIIIFLLFMFQGHTGGYIAAEEPRRKRQDESKPNHVLLFTIINPMYPITVVSIPYTGCFYYV